MCRATTDAAATATVLPLFSAGAAAAAVLPASVNVEGVELSASTYDLTVA